MRSFLSFAIAASAVSPLAAADVPIWGRWEQAFTARPADSVSVTLTSPTGKKTTIDAFQYDATTQRARFMPDEVGNWSFIATAGPKAGSFKVVANNGADRFSKHGRVQVAKAGTYLEHADGTPFFWLGDTAWNAVTNSTKAEWDRYLKSRTANHFTGVQTVILTPWRCATGDLKGNSAFSIVDGKAVINPEYYKQIDERLDSANAAGVLVAPGLIWAHKKGDAGFDLPEDDVIRICKYEVARYGAHHVMWVLAGDNSYNPAQAARWKRVGRAVFGEGTRAPVATHPTGMNWPWESWGDEKWLTVLIYQSGHGSDDNTLKWIHSGPVSRTWEKKPLRPIINVEPPYENHFGYQSRKPHSDFSVRRATYWSLLVSPNSGVSYGGHGVWSWHTMDGQTPLDHPETGPAMSWEKALELPGAVQMKHMHDLFASLKWWTLRPVAVLPGKDASEAVAIAASADRSLVMAYLPKGGALSWPSELKPNPRLKAEWFDPNTATRHKAESKDGGIYQAPNDKQDWVLILQ